MKILKRKLKMALGLGLLTFLVTGGLAVWGVVAGFNYVTHATQNFNVGREVEAFKADARSMPALIKSGCLDQAQNLLSVRAWLDQPIFQNIGELKVACIEQTQEPLCEGAECSRIQQMLRTADQGNFI